MADGSGHAIETGSEPDTAPKRPLIAECMDMACIARSRPERAAWLKRVLVLLWRELPKDERQTFVDRLEARSLDFIPLQKTGDTQFANVMWQIRPMIEHFDGQDKAFLEKIAKLGPTWTPTKDTTRRYLLDLFRRWKRDLADLTGVESE